MGYRQDPPCFRHRAHRICDQSKWRSKPEKRDRGCSNGIGNCRITKGKILFEAVDAQQISKTMMVRVVHQSVSFISNLLNLLTVNQNQRADYAETGFHLEFTQDGKQFIRHATCRSIIERQQALIWLQIDAVTVCKNESHHRPTSEPVVVFGTKRTIVFDPIPPQIRLLQASGLIMPMAD